MIGRRAPLLLGTYVPGDSILHRLDPGVKLGILASLSLAAAWYDNPASLACLLLFVAALFPAAGIPLGPVVGGLRRYLWLLAFTGVLQAGWTPGVPLAVADLGVATVVVTVEGLRAAGVLTLRLAVLIAAAQLLSAVTPPHHLGSAVAGMLRPLRPLGVDPESTGLAVWLSCQFLPTLHREAALIRTAQLARGIAHLDASPLKRLRAAPALLVPLVVRAVERSEHLATAILSRGYRPGMKMPMVRPPVIAGRDGVAVAVVAAAVLASALAGHV